MHICRAKHAAYNWTGRGSAEASQPMQIASQHIKPHSSDECFVAAGMLHDPFHTPANQPAQAALSALLTQSLSARLAEADPRPLLVCLNSSMETAQVIWNSGMREELLKVGPVAGHDCAVWLFPRAQKEDPVESGCNRQT